MSKIIDIVRNTSLYIAKHNRSRLLSKKTSKSFIEILNKNLITKKNNIKIYTNIKTNIVKNFLKTICLINNSEYENGFFRSKEYSFNDFLLNLNISNTRHVCYLDFIKEFLHFKESSKNYKMYDCIKKNFYLLLNKDVKNINYLYNIKRLCIYKLKNVFLKLMHSVGLIVNSLILKNKMFTSVLDVNFVVSLSNFLKKKGYYKKYAFLILDLVQMIYTSMFFTNIENKNCIKKLGNFVFYDLNKNLVYINWIKSLYKKFLTVVLCNKKVVELFLNSQCLGSLFIRLKVKKNKSIKLDLISDKKIVKKVLRSDICHFRHAIFKAGIRFEDVTIQHRHTNDIDFLKKYHNYRSYIMCNINHVITKNRNKNVFKLFFLNFNRSFSKQNIIDVYI
ncbi:MAG: hypothetical protein U0W94_00365 [Buchnera aphidicola (Schlechtendalia peitan)]